MSIEPSTRNAKSTASAGTHSAGERESAEIEKTVSAPSRPGSVEAVRAFQMPVRARHAAAYARPTRKSSFATRIRPAAGGARDAPQRVGRVEPLQHRAPRGDLGALGGHVQVDVDEPVADAHQREAHRDHAGGQVADGGGAHRQRQQRQRHAGAQRPAAAAAARAAASPRPPPATGACRAVPDDCPTMPCRSWNSRTRMTQTPQYWPNDQYPRAARSRRGCGRRPGVVRRGMGELVHRGIMSHRLGAVRLDPDITGTMGYTPRRWLGARFSSSTS